MKTLKIFAWSYLIKTIMVGVAWLFIPDLPARTAAYARDAWARVQSGWSTEKTATVVPSPPSK